MTKLTVGQTFREKLRSLYQTTKIQPAGIPTSSGHLPNVGGVKTLAALSEIPGRECGSLNDFFASLNNGIAQRAEKAAVVKDT
ncbi:MAG: hypothetical protein PHE17_17890 [Thiothrix sp.]|uniref:hypothetical protein n=1 Tax=Thiothrix sp. TaxID=1032 RepID=UPI002633D2D9|nr:hypothetical protein [Thiothrix sp.]MDD5394892.1 hypothetical protein [Thiothrix sp.]